MSSIQDRIARKAGVSQSTVSRALRNHPALPAATCRRIQAIAKEFGYAPNPLLSSVLGSLRRGQGGQRIGAIAFLTAHSSGVDWRSVGTFRDFFDGARSRAASYGFALEHFRATGAGLDGTRLGDILCARGITGVVVGTRCPPERLAVLEWERFAAVKIGLSQPGLPLHCVANHQFRTVRLVAEKLAERGYRRVGLVLSTWQNDVTDQNWLAGFLVWQETQPRAGRVPILLRPALSRRSLLEWRRARRPDAIIAVNGDVLGWLRESDWPAPERVGFALLDWHLEDGDVAGADQDSAKTGMIAVDLVMAQLRNHESGFPACPQTVLIQSRWHEGATVGRAIGA